MDVSFLAVVGLLRGRLLALFVLVASLALAVARILAAVVVLVVAAGSGNGGEGGGCLSEPVDGIVVVRWWGIGWSRASCDVEIAWRISPVAAGAVAG